jgi:hypothetical protein
VAFFQALLMASADSGSPRKKHKGNKPSPFWTLFTEEGTPHLLKSATCKHCGKSVFHHFKSESAQRHLRECPPFRQFMLKRNVQDRPEWFTKLKARYNRSSDSSQQLLTFSVDTVPRLTKEETHEFWVLLATFFYMTGTSFQRVEDPLLLRAIQVIVFLKLICLS